MNVTCPFSGRKFPVGETWYHVMPTSDDTFCVTCRCSQVGKSLCSSRSCNKGAQNSCFDTRNLTALEAECCSKCQGTFYKVLTNIERVHIIEFVIQIMDRLKGQPTSRFWSNHLHLYLLNLTIPHRRRRAFKRAKSTMTVSCLAAIQVD